MPHKDFSIIFEHLEEKNALEIKHQMQEMEETIEECAEIKKLREIIEDKMRRYHTKKYACTSLSHPHIKPYMQENQNSPNKSKQAST